MEFSRQEYWNGLPFPSPGDLPDPGIKPESLTSPAPAGRLCTSSATWEAPSVHVYVLMSHKDTSHIELLLLLFSRSVTSDFL